MLLVNTVVRMGPAVGRMALVEEEKRMEREGGNGD